MSAGRTSAKAALATERSRPPDIHIQLGTLRHASRTGCESSGKRIGLAAFRAMPCANECEPARSQIFSRSPGNAPGGAANHGCASGTTGGTQGLRKDLFGLRGGFGPFNSFLRVSHV